MTTKFVDPLNGNDSTGTGAIGAPWKTLAKAIGPTPAFTLSGSGQDVLVLIPSAAARESNFLVSITPTNTNTFLIVGDVDGTYQQAAGAGTIYTGDAVWCTYNAASGPPDLQGPAASGGQGTCNLNGKSYITLSQLVLIGGSNGSSGACVAAVTSHSHDITVQKCCLQALATTVQYAIRYTEAANAAANWVVDSCIFLTASNQEPIWVSLTDPAAASDIDVNFTVKNCLLMSPSAEGVHVNMPTTATGGGKPGGVRVRNCTFFCNAQAMYIQNTSGSSTIPCELYNCIFIGGGNPTLKVDAGGTALMIEDYNTFVGCLGTRTAGIAVGANSVSSNVRNAYFEIGHAFLYGRPPRPFFTPLPLPGASGLVPLLGFGNGGTNPTPPTVDALGRPRPSGGAYQSSQAGDSGTSSGTNTSTTLNDTAKTWTVNAFAGYRVKITGGTGAAQYRSIISNTATALTIDLAWATTPDATSTYAIDNPGKYPGLGYVERHEPAVQETGTVDVSPSIRIYGPGDQEFLVPVPASASTISVKVRRDSNYGGGTNPTLHLLAEPRIGVAAQDITDAGSAGVWNTLTTSSFTPTAAGVVRVRLDCTGSAGNGNTYWDTATVPTLSATGGTEGFDFFVRGEPFPALTHDAAGGGGSSGRAPGILQPNTWTNED